MSKANQTPLHLQSSPHKTSSECQPAVEVAHSAPDLKFGIHRTPHSFFFLATTFLRSSCSRSCSRSSVRRLPELQRVVELAMCWPWSKRASPRFHTAVFKLKAREHSSSHRSEGCGSVTKRRRGGGGGIIGENKLGMLAMEEPLISFLQCKGLPPSLAIHPVARTAPQPLSYLPGTGQACGERVTLLPLKFFTPTLATESFPCSLNPRALNPGYI